MPHAEFIGWQQFYAVEPWGLQVQDAMQANAVSVLANVNRDSERKPQAYQIRDFMLFMPPEPPKSEPMVEGKTAAQWQLIHAAEALQAIKPLISSGDAPIM